MRVFIEVDERYPEYILVHDDDDDPSDPSDYVLEVDDATVARWEKVVGEYEQVQIEMAKALKNV